MKPWLIYLIILNALSLLFMLTDKHNAVKGDRRIPERTLILLSILGGSPGCLIGMYAARHKTRRLKFALGIPVIFLLQLALFLLAYTNKLPGL